MNGERQTMTRATLQPMTSWGRHFRWDHRVHRPVSRLDEMAFLKRDDGPFCPYGQGRSLGDVCLNRGGALIRTDRMDHLVSFDRQAGVLRCEAGARLGDLLAVTVPAGFLLPVLPGTRHTSVGGAIANDVHGKNHHRAGTFGCHVQSMEVLRSNGERVSCSPTENADLFRATIGGLGLTGLIVTAEIRLSPIAGAEIESEAVRFRSLAEFRELSEASGADSEYVVAWIDCLAGGSRAGRGVLFRGNRAGGPGGPYRSQPEYLRIPVDVPGGLMHRPLIRAFNAVYNAAHSRRTGPQRVPLDRFFFPQDVVGGWNRLYGKRGLTEFQFCLPRGEENGIAEILRRVSQRGDASFMAVIKEFGDRPSPGLLSFPRPGITLALDFPFRGEPTRAAIVRLIEEVADRGGRVYPAKDSVLTPALFRRCLPEWEALSAHVDPRFSSSFWRRVIG